MERYPKLNQTLVFSKISVRFNNLQFNRFHKGQLITQIAYHPTINLRSYTHLSWFPLD